MTPAPGTDAPRLRTVWIVLLLGLLFGQSQFQRAAGGVMGPVLAEDLGLWPTALGAIAAALFLSSAPAQFPIGLALDRFGPRRTLPAMMTITIVGTIWFAMADTVTELVLARILIGIGSAATLMSAYSIIARWFAADRFATVSAWMLAVASVGSLLGTAPLAALIEAIGWRASFFAAAAVTAVFVIAAAIWLRDAPPGYQAKVGPPQNLRENLSGLLQVLGDRRYRYILAMALIAYGPSMTILGIWGGPYLRDVHGAGSVQQGQILLAMVVASVVGSLVFGPLDRVFRTRKGVVLAAASVMSLCLISLALLTQPALATSIALFVGLAFAQQFYVVLAAHSRASFPDHLIGRVATTQNFVSITGVALLQYVFSLVVAAFPAEGGAAPELAYRWGFGVIGACVVIAALIYTRSTDVGPGQTAA